MLKNRIEKENSAVKESDLKPFPGVNIQTITMTEKNSHVFVYRVALGCVPHVRRVSTNICHRSEVNAIFL